MARRCRRFQRPAKMAKKRGLEREQGGSVLSWILSSERTLGIRIPTTKGVDARLETADCTFGGALITKARRSAVPLDIDLGNRSSCRSEERHVGKECRS